MNNNISALLDRLPFTLQAQHDSGGVLLSVKEFPEAIEYAPDMSECLANLAAGMKEWAEVLSERFDDWRKGREQEVPYLLKILDTSEGDLLSCLRKSKCESI